MHRHYHPDGMPSYIAAHVELTCLRKRTRENQPHRQLPLVRPKKIRDFAYRFNRRFDLSTLNQRLLVAAVRSAPAPRRVFVWLTFIASQEDVWERWTVRYADGVPIDGQAECAAASLPTNEFLTRPPSWPALQRNKDLPFYT